MGRHRGSALREKMPRGARTGRTLAQIVRANVLTRFNAILGVLFVLVLVVGPLQDSLFGIVLAVNTSVGVLQELRARRTLDRLALLHAPVARVIRDGDPVEVPPGDVVVGDDLVVRAGDQLVADGVVADGRVDVDESMVSGETLPVEKRSGAEVLSGTVIVAGSATVHVARVGDQAFVASLESEARRFHVVRSELMVATNRILRIITWAMVPIGGLLISSQFARADESFADAVRGAVAGVGAMVPEGLVLLTSVAFALGAVRLARLRVLAQELAAVEGLARVDLVCVDKTGTLTEPGISLRDVVAVGRGEVTGALAQMAHADPTPNATMLALREVGAISPGSGWDVRSSVPFASTRGWSAMEFSGHGTFVLGVPDVVVPNRQDLRPVVAEQTGAGRRVLAFASSPARLGDGTLPAALDALALVVLEERIRPDAAATVEYLKSQGIAIRVLSGDDPSTVGAVARELGIPGADHPADGRTLPEGSRLSAALDDAFVIGRVQPAQKRDIVAALKRSGHVVAMTGDGLNDIPALKVADLGMAMGSGMPATRAVGKIVLLENSFSVVPKIVDEGRRVIANVERVATLFVTKTVYAALVAFVVGVAALPYPFYPRHLTIVSSVTIGVPAFFLAFAPGAPRARPGFFRRVATVTGPAGVVVGAAVLCVYGTARGVLGESMATARTASVVVLIVLGLAVLVHAARPLSPLRRTLIASMGFAAVAVFVVAPARTFFALSLANRDVWVLVALVCVAGSFVLGVALRAAERLGARWRDAAA